MAAGELNKAGSVALPDDALPIIPVRNLVVFPGEVAHVSIGRQVSIEAARLAVEQSRKLGILLQLDPSQDLPAPEDLHPVGTIVSIVRFVTAPNGMHHLICQGEQRFEPTGFVDDLPCLATRFEAIDEPEEVDAEVRARVSLLKERTEEITRMLPEVPADFSATVLAIESPGAVADVIAGFLDIDLDEKQRVLETIDVRWRLDRVLNAAEEQLNVLRIAHEIGAKSKEKIDKQQRDYILREQLRTIQRELGEESGGSDLEELAAAVEQAGMPPEVHKEARKELKRLRMMPEASGEHSMVRVPGGTQAQPRG